MRRVVCVLALVATLYAIMAILCFIGMMRYAHVVAAGANKNSYDVLKDVAIPLATLLATLATVPATAILFPLILFYVLPRLQERQKAAIELFASFHTEEMRAARQATWQYFVTDFYTLALTKDVQIKRLSDYLEYLSEPKKNTNVKPDDHLRY